MCIDQSKWHYCQYRKHVTPPKYREKVTADIDRLTLESDALYYPQFQPRDVEQQVVDGGIYVQSSKAHKVFKIYEFEWAIGACNGQSSRWVKIEVTSGEFHGRPITQEQFMRFLGRQVPCCG